jgi:hypothetical protein
MWFKRKKVKTLSLFDDHGHKISILFRRFNKVVASVDTDVEDFVVDAHFKALDNYNGCLLSLLVKRNKLVSLTRDLLHVGRIDWNLTRINDKIKRVVRNISNKLGFANSKRKGGEVNNE